MGETLDRMQPPVPSARRRKQWRGGSKLLAIPALAALALTAMLSAGWQVMAVARQGEALFSKIERAVKVKEPRWKLVQKNERKGAVQKYFTQEWERGKEYVSTTTYEMADAETAAKELADFVTPPDGSVSTSVLLRRTKIHGLGDEAYTFGDSPYGRKGAGTLVARRGHVLIRLDASSLVVAKRFAKHMLDEVNVK